MRIWVDGDAMPRPVKDILFRLADARPIESWWWPTSGCGCLRRGTSG
jgi:hypothetical protein